MQSDPNVSAGFERAEQLVEDASRLASGGPPNAGPGPLAAPPHRVLHGQTASLLKEGFEHSKHWAHTTSIFFVFASDFLQKIIPHCTRQVLIGALALLVLLGLAFKFLKLEHKKELGSSVAVFCLITAILSSVMLGLQYATGESGEKNGALAELAPDIVKPMQDWLQQKLGIIETKIDKVKEDTEALRKAQREETARAEQRHTELKRLMIDAAGGGAAATQAVAEIRDLLRPDVPGIDEIPADKLPGSVKQILVESQKPAARPEDFSGTVKRVLTEAQARAEELNFADAAKVLDAALARTEAEDKDRARGHAALLAERGRIARLQLRYREAADYYAKAAQAAAFDPAIALRHTLDGADALYAQGDEFGENQALLDAIRVYRSALDMVPRARAPLEWAKTQNNLGNALWSLGERESGTARLEEPVAAYREALQENTPARAPLAWAATQMNLGNALARLGERESGTSRLEEAAAAYRAALQESTRARAPLEWAKTQMNLGNALFGLGERESGTARLEEAVTAYREALQELTRERVPLEWARTQMNLGNALQTLGRRESGTARLQEAVAAYRDALKENTSERVPLDWAATQTNLGAALRALGARESGTAARLEEGVAAYREALQEITRARVPLDWAMTQMNLGAALETLGERVSGTTRLEEAVAAYREALQENTRARVPLQWAKTQNNLGTALAALGQPGERDGAARSGRYRLSRSPCRKEPARACHSTGPRPRTISANALRALGERESGTARLEEAVSAYREALQENTRARVPLEWA